MGKQAITTNEAPDFFSNIKSVTVPESVRRVMVQQNQDPNQWQSQLNQRIQAGGATKEEALSRAFTLFDQIEGSQKYTNLLVEGLKAKRSKVEAVETQAANVPQPIPVQEPTSQVQQPAESTERVSASQAFMGSLWNSLTQIVEGSADFLNESSRFYDKIAPSLPGSGNTEKVMAALAETNFTKNKKGIDSNFEKIRARVDAESKKQPFSFSTNQKGNLEVDFSEIDDPKKWMAALGSGIGSLVSILAPTKKASMLMSFTQMYSDNQDEAIEAGLQGNSAAAYASGVSLVGSALEMLGDAGILKAVKGDAGRQVIKQVVKDKSGRALTELAEKGLTPEIFQDVVQKTFTESLKELGNSSRVASLKNIARKIGRAAAPEAGTEFAQEWSTYAGKSIYNDQFSDGAEAGKGAFSTDAYKTLGDATFGALMGAFLGGAIGTLAPNSKEQHETLGAFINADIKAQLEANPSLTIDDIKQNARFNNLLKVATANGQFNDETGKPSQQKIDDITQKANLIYDTYYDFKDMPGFSGEDRLAMFNVTDVRNRNATALNQLNQTVGQIQEVQSDIDNLTNTGGNPLTITKLQAAKSQMEQSLGDIDPVTGQYNLIQQAENNNARMENVFQQAIPAISSQDTNLKALGRSFLNSNIDSFRNEAFVPESETILQDGSVIVRDNDSTAIRRVVVQPVQQESTIAEQINSTDYKPIRRFEKSFEPIDNFGDYRQAAQNIQNDDLSRVSYDTTSPYDYAEDARELLQTVAGEVQAVGGSPNMETRVNKAYDLYNQIVDEDTRTRIPSVAPLSYEEFSTLVGFTPQAANTSTETVVDPLEATILQKQQELGLPSTVEEVYNPSERTMDTIVDILEGSIETPISKIDSATKELLAMRKMWQNRRRSSKREFTFGQIDDVIREIEADLETLQNEKSYQEDPESRPQPEPISEPTTNESDEDTTQNESTDSEGNTSATNQPRSVQSEYTSAAAIEELLEPAIQQEGELSEILGSAIESTEAAIQAEDEQQISRAIADAQRALESIGQSDGLTEGIIGAVDTIVNEDTGDGSGSTEGTQPDESPVITVTNRRKLRKDQRRIVNPERIAALRKFPNNITEEVYQYFVGNGQVNTRDVNRLFRGTGNTERQNMVASTADYGLTIDELAHRLWENTNFPGNETDVFKDAIEETILSYPGIEELTRRLNTSEEQGVDPDFDESTLSDQQPEGIQSDAFIENIRRSQQDPDFVPFDTQGANANQAQAIQTLNRMGKAFPGIIVNVPATAQEFNDQLSTLTGSQTLYTTDNQPYGYINPKDGSINLDPARLNPNTSIHEFGHIWTMWAKVNNPELYNQGKLLVKDTAYYRDVKGREAYRNNTEDQILDEAIATAIGNKGSSFVTTTKRNKFTQWMSDLFDGVKKFLGIKKPQPSQIADMNFDQFTEAVVRDLLSENPISQMTSDEIANILQSGNQDTVISELADVPSDPIMHTTAVLFGAPGSGETIGTSQELQDQAREELRKEGVFGKLEENQVTRDINGNTTTSTITERGMNDKDRAIIRDVATRYGWKYIGAKYETQTDPVTGKKTKVKIEDRWERDISKEKNSFFLRGNKTTFVPIKGMAGRMGRMARPIQSTEEWMENLRATGNPIYKTVAALINSSFDRLTNLETFVKAIDNAEGLYHAIIHDIKREASDNRNYALNIMGRSYEEFRREIGKYTTHKGSRTVDTVEKLPVKILQWSRTQGKGVERQISLPVSVVMNIVASHQSQLSMGVDYNQRKVKNASGAERTENHTSLVVDEYYNTDPTDKSLFWKSGTDVEDVHKGVHFKKDVAMEGNAQGELEPLKDGMQYGLFSQAEMDRMVDYVTSSGPEAVKSGYQKIKQGFNNATVRELLRKENDEAINPSDPFVDVPDYSPLQTVSKMSTQDRVNSFSPNLEDAKQLNERKSRPDAIYAEDIIDSFDYYREAVGHILGSTKLVHNLKNLQQAIQSDYEGPMKKRVDSILADTIDNLQNFRQTQYAVSKGEKALRPLLVLMSKYTATIFRSNLGISTKQIGTWFSAAGLGYIDGRYLFRNWNTFGKMLDFSLRGSTIDRFAGGSLVEATGQGFKVGKLDTAEAGLIRELLGENITDPVQKEQHLRNWATVIQRVVYGNSQYTEAGNLGTFRFTKAGAAKAKQLWNYSDSMFEEYGMANIRRLDRGVILGYMYAAKQQVAAEIRDGKITRDQADARGAELVTETLYLTNQMNDPADLTMLQRSPTFANRVIALYSGQTQKLWNQMSGAAIEYYKKRDTASPEELKILRDRVIWSAMSNLLFNTAWMATANLGASVLRGWLAGEEPKEASYYKEKYLWDIARYITGLAPGLWSQASQMVISSIDNEKWTDTMFDVPGADTFKQAIDLAKGVYGLVDNTLNDALPGETKKDNDKLTSEIVYNFARIFGTTTGAPKTWIDPVAKRINGKIDPPKGTKTSDFALEEDLSFDLPEDDDFDDIEFDD